jgi:hypothetical protein
VTSSSRPGREGSDEYRAFEERERRLHTAREQWRKQRDDKERRKSEIKAARIVGNRRPQKQQQQRLKSKGKPGVASTERPS